MQQVISRDRDRWETWKRRKEHTEQGERYVYCRTRKAGASSRRKEDQ
jgi:hypothetical protein